MSVGTLFTHGCKPARKRITACCRPSWPGGTEGMAATARRGSLAQPVARRRRSAHGGTLAVHNGLGARGSVLCAKDGFGCAYAAAVAGTVGAFLRRVTAANRGPRSWSHLCGIASSVSSAPRARTRRPRRSACLRTRGRPRIACMSTSRHALLAAVHRTRSTTGWHVSRCGPRSAPRLVLRSVGHFEFRHRSPRSARRSDSLDRSDTHMLPSAAANLAAPDTRTAGARLRAAAHPAAGIYA